MPRFLLPLVFAIPIALGVFWLIAQEQHPSVAALPEGVRFSAPIECSDPATCVVQNHVDLKQGPGTVDPACGTRTYDEHHGVDFRILDLPTMMGGVPVMAAAPGTVLRLRDGEYDGAWNAQGREVVGGRDCGNGVVIAHEDGYETFYCHLRRDSVRVEVGQTVARGTPIAEVGMSGRAEFPHVHFAVLKDGTRLDPFTGRAVGEACGEGGTPLWQGPIPAHWAADAEPTLFKAGFTERSVTLPLIERGLPQPTRDAGALVFYARAIWLDAGDVQKIQIEGPPGFEPIGMVDEPLERGKAQAMVFVGRPGKDGGFPPGLYRGSYQVERNGTVVLEHEQSVTLE